MSLSYERGFDHSGLLDLSAEDQAADDLVRTQLFGAKVVNMTNDVEFAHDYEQAMLHLTKNGRKRAIGFESRSVGMMGVRPGDGRRNRVTENTREAYQEALLQPSRVNDIVAFSATHVLRRLLSLRTEVEAPFPIGTLQEAGISLEMGHRFLFGGWRAASLLDDAVNQALDPEKLAASGLEIERKYERDEQHVQYSFSDISLEGLSHRFIAVVRKRPVADLVFTRKPSPKESGALRTFARETGTSQRRPRLPRIEIAKRSPFIIAYDLLDATQQAAMDAALRMDEDERLLTYRTAGAITEEVIAMDPAEQESQLRISPVMALYFNRIRLRRGVNRAVDQDNGMAIVDVLSGPKGF